MKKMSEVLARRREGKRLKAIVELPSVVAMMLERSPGVVVTPGTNNWPEMSEEEQEVLNEKIEERGYAYASVHIVLIGEPDFRVSIFGLNAPSVWGVYTGMIKDITKDLPGEEAQHFKNNLSKSALVEKERLEKTHGVQLEPLEW